MLPSEKFLLVHRAILFLDEWLFYAVLATLFFAGHYYIMGLVAIHGAIAIGISYWRQWRFEKMRFDE